MISEFLLNKPIRKIGRASNMLWISIGDSVKYLDPFGNLQEKGEFAIHIQSEWRILSNDVIILSLKDMYEPASHIENIDLFEWDKLGDNLFDEKVALENSIIKNKEINSIKLSKCNDLHIQFSNGYVLEVFNNYTDLDSECWRILDFKNLDREHIVGYLDRIEY